MTKEISFTDHIKYLLN